MKISTKLSMFYAAVILVFCLLGGALTAVLHSVSSGYDALLDTQVREIDQARVIQVDFKKQVQEWKDILLRGQNPADLTNYTKQFHDMEMQVNEGANRLAARVEDPEAKQLLEQFLTADGDLDKKYEAAYQAYVAGNADFKAADKMVRGQDRAPTDLFDKVVARLDTVVGESVKAQSRAAANGLRLALGIAAVLLLTVGVVGIFVIRDVVNRLARLKAVSDRLAVADITGLSIDISGHDEIATFAGSMKGVLAAIEELLRATSEETMVKS